MEFGMRSLCALGLAVCVAACASAPNLEQAIAVHNILRQIVLDSDQAFAAVYSTVEPAVASETHGDGAAYDRAIAPYKVVLQALTLSKQAENTLYMALVQWQSGMMDPSAVKAAYACSADAMRALSTAAGAMPAGGALYAQAFAIQAELRAMADGAVCAPPGAGK
jgi:hypothetical protein